MKYRPRRNNSVTTISYPMPMRANTQLVFNDTNGLISALTAVNAKVYQPSSYFDPDPDVASTSDYGGFTFFSSMYSRYRVLAFKYTVIWTNLEATAVRVSCQAIPASVTPTEGTATDWTEPAIENPYGKYFVLSPTAASPTKKLSGYVNCTKLWGTPEARYDTGWAGTATTSPGVNSFLRLAAYKLDGSALSVGVQFNIRVKAYGYWDQKNQEIVG